MTPLEFVRENGWAQLIARAARSAFYRLRDTFTARKLKTSGFHSGSHPRISGLAHMRVGRNFSAGDALWLEAVVEYAGERFEPQLVLGDNINASDRVHIGCLNAITIGSGTLIGSNVLISDHAHGAYRGDVQTGPETSPTQRRLHSPAPIRIGRNVWIGDSVCVLGGAEIGDGAVIGTGSVVNGMIPAATIAVGTPARPIRQWNQASQQWLPCERRDIRE